MECVLEKLKECQPVLVVETVLCFKAFHNACLNQVVSFTITSFWEYSAADDDDNFFFFFFFLFVLEKKNCQSSGKNKKNIYKCRLLNFLPQVPSVLLDV